jgi:hypothetical protein
MVRLEKVAHRTFYMLSAFLGCQIRIFITHLLFPCLISSTEFNSINKRLTVKFEIGFTPKHSMILC